MPRLAVLGGVALCACALQGCSGGHSGAGGWTGPVSLFTTWNTVQPGEAVIINGTEQHASYKTSGGTVSVNPPNITGVTATIGLASNSMDPSFLNLESSATKLQFDATKGDDFGTLDGDFSTISSADGNNAVVLAKATDQGLHYQTFGVWLTGMNSGSGTVSAASFGNPAIGVPNTGTVTYEGKAVGLATVSNVQSLVLSDAKIEVTYTDGSNNNPGSFTFDTTNSMAYDPTGATLTGTSDDHFNISGGGALNGNTFNGFVATDSTYAMGGAVNGTVFGDASEVGGLFAVANSSGTNTYIGSYGAAQVSMTP